MLIRIVKLTFQPEKANDFITIFKSEREKILTFDGCSYVELWRDTAKANVFFTHSRWRDQAALDAYRNSDFFKHTWARAKALFAEKAEAWSVKGIED